MKRIKGGIEDGFVNRGLEMHGSDDDVALIPPRRPKGNRRFHRLVIVSPHYHPPSPTSNLAQLQSIDDLEDGVQEVTDKEDWVGLGEEPVGSFLVIHFWN